MQKWAISGAKTEDGKYIVTKIGEQEILKIRMNFHGHKTGKTADVIAAEESGEGDRSCTDENENFSAGGRRDRHAGCG